MANAFTAFLSNLGTALKSKAETLLTEAEQDLSTPAGRAAALTHAQSLLTEFTSLITELDPGAAASLSAIQSALSKAAQINNAAQALGL